MENPQNKMDDLRVPPFEETPIKITSFLIITCLMVHNPLGFTHALLPPLSALPNTALKRPLASAVHRVFSAGAAPNAFLRGGKLPTVARFQRGPTTVGIENRLLTRMRYGMIISHRKIIPYF